MDSESDDGDAPTVPTLIPPVVRGPANVERIRALAPREIQKYIDEPPGEGKSVVYAFACVVDGKAYVGKHGHGRLRQSVRSSRLKSFFNPSASQTTHKANAVRKHGRDAFEPFVLWHGDECDENAMECFWISPAGLHTRPGDGGWGYNDQKGGDGGVHSEATIQRIKNTKSTPEHVAAASARAKKQFENETDEARAERIRKLKETMTTSEYVAAASERTKQQMEREAAAGMKSLAERGREYSANETDEARAERLCKANETNRTPETKAKRSASAKKQFENETDEARAERLRKAAETKSSPEWKAAASARAKKQFENETDEARAERIRKLKETMTTPEYVAAASARGAKQFENETDEARSKRKRKERETKATPEYVSAASARAKKQFESQEARDELRQRAEKQFANETDEARAERLRKLKEAHNTPEYAAAASARGKQQFESQEARDELSQRAKKQMEREAAAGMKPLHERSRYAQLAKQSARLATLQGVELERETNRIACEARKSAKKMRDLATLRSVPGYEDAKLKDLPKARATGLLTPKPMVVDVPSLGCSTGSFFDPDTDDESVVDAPPLKRKAESFFDSDTDEE
jgi:hypothetical protein